MHSLEPVLGWAGAGLVIACVVAYWAYSFSVLRAPAISAALVWPVRVGRLPALLLGVGLAVLTGDLLPAALAVVGSGYALTRQWAWPSLAPRAAVRPEEIGGTELVAVLPDGGALTVGWLEQARTVRHDRWLLVACSLAGSLAAFEDVGPVAASLPLAVGFELRGPAGRWHGVTGEARDGGAPLRRAPLRLLDYADWRRRFPGGQLLGPIRGPIRSSRRRRNRVPGAAARGAGADRGLVRQGGWSLGVSTGEGGWFIARWAARELGLPGA